MVYSYPVIFDIYNVKGVKVIIPDLDCHKIFNNILLKFIFHFLIYKL